MLMLPSLQQADNDSRMLAWSTIALVALTSAHHIYGGALYGTSWRIVMSLGVFLPLLALTLFLQYQSVKRSSRLLLTAFTALSVTWIVGIGLYEGGYNHVLKNILYFGGAPEGVMLKMFPPEFGGTKLYETPNDFIFESSGVATTFVALVMLRFLVPFAKQQWKRNRVIQLAKERPDPVSVPQASNTRALIAIKLAHTVVWAFFAACIVALPVASWYGRHTVALWLGLLVAIEVVVLALNQWRCPLTSFAGRYTPQREDNFDIYLPLWLARYNKVIFGTLYFVGVVFAAWSWARQPS
jgi:hypothetical protein